MKLLLDTHIYIWSVAGSRKLSDAGRDVIERADQVFVSSESIWEAAIKASLGKLHVDISLLAAAIAASGFLELPVAALHAVRVRDLPHIHRDPFDRILVAQSMHEPMHFLTADKELVPYSPLVIAV